MKTRNIVISVILLALAFYVGFKSNKVEVVKTKTETITKYDTIIKTIDNTKPQKIEKVYVKVPKIIRDTINYVIKDTVFNKVKTNKYTYVDTLENGRLTSTILADKIYKRSISLETFNKETISNTTNTIIKSSVMLGVDTNINQGIQQTSFNLYYIHKDKWLVKGGLGYDLPNQNSFYSFGVALKF